MNTDSPTHTDLSAIVNSPADHLEEISRVLHDGMGQLLVAARLMADGTPECPPIVSSLLSDAIIELHRLCDVLAEPATLGMSLTAAIESLTKRISRLPGVSCTFTAQISATESDASHDVHLYRIAQESVGNSLSHGRASAVSVVLRRTLSYTVLIVSDNGTWVAADSRRPHRGLNNMRSRAATMGGILEIRGRRGERGTEVICRIPNRPGPDPLQVELSL